MKSRVIAVCLWMLLVLFLALMLWPSESGSIKSIWSSLQTTEIWDKQNENSGAPFWFVASGVGLIAAIYTLPGLVFCFSKQRISFYHDFWNARSQTVKVVERAEEMHQHTDNARAATETASYLQNDAERAAIASSIGSSVLQIYEDAIRTRINSAQTQLTSGVALQPIERQALQQTIVNGQQLLLSVSNLSI